MIIVGKSAHTGATGATGAMGALTPTRNTTTTNNVNNTAAENPINSIEFPEVDTSEIQNMRGIAAKSTGGIMTYGALKPSSYGRVR